jgi:transcriptional regulator with XRE-family HTH domain
MATMTGEEFRQRRKAAKLTQAQAAEALGYHRDHIGLIERGLQPINDRTIMLVSAIFGGESVEAGPLPPLQSTDPMERIVERALQESGLRYVVDRDGAIPENLDFHLPDEGVFIEVKRMHTPRISDQMARAPNVIVAQGEDGVRFLARAIKAIGRARETAAPGIAGTVGS